jgi:hypothetical protein
MINFSNLKKYWIGIVIPILIFILTLLILDTGKSTNSKSVIDVYKEIDKEQTKRIENLETIVKQHRDILLMKIKKDSILTIQSQVEINKLNQNIKDLKKANEKVRININNADIDASYDILTNNIKKRQR